MPDAVDKTAQKLQKIARLYRGTTSAGERVAAQAAFDRVRLGTRFATISINSFHLRSCGCATIPCKHWAAQRRSAPKAPEQEAIEKACQETLAQVREALAWDSAWDDIAHVYARGLSWLLHRALQPRLTDRHVRFLKDFAWRLEIQRPPTDDDKRTLNAILAWMRAMEEVRTKWAAERSCKQAAAAHARRFRWPRSTRDAKGRFAPAPPHP
jgi:hypothetical protein